MPRPPLETALVPRFVAILAAIAVAGAAALVIGNVVGSVIVPQYDWVADTVSDLSAGRYEIVQDVTLYAYAGSLVALAVAAAHLHTGSGRWSAAIFVLLALALCVTIIAARNEFGDGDSDGVEIHIYVVYVLGALFAALFVLAALEAGPLSGSLRWTSWICAVLWICGAPVFFFMPTGWDGLYERGLGLITIVWVLVLAAHLIRRARSGL
jgi:hypothetical protein